MAASEERIEGDGGGRGYLVLLVPLVALVALGAWLVGSGTLDRLRGDAAYVAREERALLAIDATAPGEAEDVLAALELAPSAWSPEVRGAVARLLDRADWPPEATEGAGRALAERAPVDWTEQERAAVEDLLELFRLRRFPARVPLDGTDR